MGKKYKCQHLPEVDRRPWVAKTTSTGRRIWKDASMRMREIMKCCVFRYPHKLLLVVCNLGVNVLTPDKTRKQHILGTQISSMLNK
ncbi:hypothetical protein AAG906_037018 [Vitis piasezkii]